MPKGVRTFTMAVLAVRSREVFPRRACRRFAPSRTPHRGPAPFAHIDRRDTTVSPCRSTRSCFEVNADDGECGDLWQTGKGRPKMTGGHGLVFRIEIAVTDQPRQEFGLVAGGSRCSRVRCTIVSMMRSSRGRGRAQSYSGATFEREDQRGCRHGDDHAKHDRQGRADGNVARSPPRGSSIAAALLRSLTSPALPRERPSGPIHGESSNR